MKNILNCIKACLLKDNKNENTQKTSAQNSTAENKDFISIDDFTKLDLRVGLVKSAEQVEGSDKLIKCTVDFGELGERTIVSGIKNYRAPEELVGKKFVYIVNLEPRKIFGIESQGMILAVSDENDLAILVPDRDIKQGSKVS